MAGWTGCEKKTERGVTCPEPCFFRRPEKGRDSERAASTLVASAFRLLSVSIALGLGRIRLQAGWRCRMATRLDETLRGSQLNSSGRRAQLARSLNAAARDGPF